MEGKRVAFAMRLKPGSEAEYRRRHDELWPEVAAALKQAGISSYSIFLDRDSGALFGVQDQSDPVAAANLKNHPAIRKWWSYMAPLMDCHPDHEPVATPLYEVFHLD